MTQLIDSRSVTSHTVDGVPSGAYRKRIGEMTITALRDGHFDLPLAYFSGLDAVESERLLRSASRSVPPRIDVNAFLIEAGGKRILVDTGCGSKLGPTVNQLRRNLVANGVSEASIDTVLCTHIHPDHTNGLIDESGAPVFINAEVVVHQAELEFWLSKDQMEKAPAALRPQFAWAMEAFAPYQDRIRTFRQGNVASGIDAVPLYGHTPGHSGFLIHSGKEQLLVWADCVHSIAIQAAHPEVSFAADVDPDAARLTRQRLFDQVATDRLLVTGMHMEFPGFGYLERAGQSFRYEAMVVEPTVLPGGSSDTVS
jgi:glyoxylase-like metal-dependent hydrolase (beta-lactamase superfamily II)